MLYLTVAKTGAIFNVRNRTLERNESEKLNSKRSYSENQDMIYAERYMEFTWSKLLISYLLSEWSYAIFKTNIYIDLSIR